MSRGFRVGRANKDFAIFVDKNVWEVHGMCMEVNSKCSLVLHDIFLEGFGHSKVYFWLLSFFFFTACDSRFTTETNRSSAV